MVRSVWSKRDSTLFVFAGAAAEFALNKAVDWLYFTGKLPADPLGRLYSTVQYARRIVFASEQDAFKAIDTITLIHRGVENKRGSQIPDWAYRDVLFMLIHYSIRSFELLERKMSAPEKNELYGTFLKMGRRMNIPGLPDDYEGWIKVRAQHLRDNYARSSYTDDLFVQYRKHLGGFRYRLLREVQILTCPPEIRRYLGLRSFSWATPLLFFYKLSRGTGIDKWAQRMLLPKKYKDEF
jgi:uncharacterized protein (DUF2236 family)